MLHTARLKTKIDVNVGDPIWPAPQEVIVPRLLDEPPLVLRGYPLHMVLADKLVTAIHRGTANTRWRDLADIYLLTRQQPVDAADLDEAMRRVAATGLFSWLRLPRSSPTSPTCPMPSGVPGEPSKT